jgi:PAS domain S-box-containing protein
MMRPPSHRQGAAHGAGSAPGGGQAKARPPVVIEIEDLRARLEEAEATLAAIRNGEVDALVVSGEQGEKVYTLQTPETPYRALVEAMNEGALTVDASGTILYANRCFAVMTGLPLERVTGGSLQALASAEAPGAIAESLKRAAQHGSDKRVVSLARLGGGAIPAMMSASLVPESQGGGVCVVFTDLTTQRREEALARAEEEARLHRDIAERRAAELARSNADLERFAQIASHDLKEPLRGISNFASFLIEDHGKEITPEGRHKLETIMRLSQRMHSLLDSLMEYAKAGRTMPRRQCCPLGPLLREAADSLAPLLADRRAQLLVDPQLPECWCDPVRLTQALTNLIVNGVKYNDAAAPVVAVSAAKGTDGAVTITVRDNGIGIEPRHHERIFSIFTRLHARDSYGGGTGVGLSIVKAIVEQHGGTIRLESTPGAGSTFFVTIPGESA